MTLTPCCPWLKANREASRENPVLPRVSLWRTPTGVPLALLESCDGSWGDGDRPGESSIRFCPFCGVELVIRVEQPNEIDTAPSE